MKTVENYYVDYDKRNLIVEFEDTEEIKEIPITDLFECYMNKYREEVLE